MFAIFVVIGAMMLCGGLALRVAVVDDSRITSAPPWPYAHVCSLAQRNDGSLAAFWQAGQAEKDPSSAIWTSRRARTGAPWTPVAPAVRLRTARGGPMCAMNAVVMRSADDRLHMTVHYGGADKVNGGGCVVQSIDSLGGPELCVHLDRPCCCADSRGRA